MSERSVSIRLGTSGKAEVVRTFNEVGEAGEAAFRRFSRAAEREGENAAAAMRRQAANLAKAQLVAPGLTPGKLDAFAGVNEGVGKSAEQSGAIFAAAYERMEARARALVAAIDPVYAAQQRFDAEMRLAKGLLDAGALSSERYAQKLQFEEQALDEVTRAQNRAAGSAGAHRSAMLGLSYQAQDTITQLALGANPLTVLAIQGGQAAGQMVNLDGKMGAVARFMTGFWGIAITAVVLGFGFLTTKLGETEDATESLLDKKRKDVDQSRAQEEANRAWARSIEGSIEATKKLTGELRQQLLTQQQLLELKARDAENQARINRSNYITAEGQLSAAENELTKAQETYRVNTTPQLSQMLADRVLDWQREVDRLRLQLDGVATSIRSADEAARAARIPLLESGVEAGLDKAKAATDAYTTALGRLREERRLNLISEEEFSRRLTTAQTTRDAALRELAKEREKTSLGAQINAARGGELLASAERYRGLSETRDTAALQTLFKAANVNVDPKMTAWCAAFVNAVLATEGLGGTGSLAARSFLTFGEKTTAPVKGDIVVSSRGTNAAQGHVGFFQGTDAKGNILVLGGNTGDRVGTMTVAKSDVLGFRRASAASDERDLAAAERERAQTLEQLTRAYLPTAAAAAKYSEVLAQIAGFEKDGGFTTAQAQMAREEAWKEYLDTLPGSKAPIKGFEPFLEMDKDRRQAEERKAEFVRSTLADQAESLTIARAELALVGANDNYREAEIGKLTLILDLKRRGIDATSDEGQEILTNAERLEALAEVIRKQKDVWAELDQAGSAAIDRLFDPSSAESWGDRVMGVIDDLKNEFVKLALLNPVKNFLFGSGLPTLGGLFGGGSAQARADAFSLPSVEAMRPTGNAVGTEYFSGGATWIAENGPELVTLPKGSKVASASQTREALKGGGGMTLHVDASIYAPNSDAAGLARVEANQQRLLEALPGMIISTWRDARERRMLN